MSSVCFEDEAPAEDVTGTHGFSSCFFRGVGRTGDAVAELSAALFRRVSAAMAQISCIVGNIGEEDNVYANCDISSLNARVVSSELWLRLDRLGSIVGMESVAFSGELWSIPIICCLLFSTYT